MENNSMINDTPEQDFQIRAIVDQYVSYWRWFVLGVAITMSVAYIYLRYSIPQYRAATTILVKDDKKGGLSSELSAFADMGISGGKSNLDNEIEILKSRSLVENTVRKMNLNIAFIVEGKVLSTNLYNKAPILLTYLEKKSDFYNEGRSYQFWALSNDTFQFIDLLGQGNVLEGGKKVFRYGQPIRTKYGTLVINKSLVNTQPYNDEVRPIKIIINPLEGVAASFRSRLSVALLSKTSSVVELSLVDPVVEQAEDFLNNLVQNYNEEAAADKNFISENTSKFIANRLALITEELDGVEKNVESFKTGNQLTNIEAEAQLFIEGSSEYDKKGIETDIQLNVITSLTDFLKKSTPSDLLPTNIASGEAQELIQEYNQLVLTRNRVLKTATEVNPTVVKISEQINALKSNVAASLSRQKNNLMIQKRDLGSQEGVFNSKIKKIPSQERQFRVIARQQKVKEELYLYLLQKREETAIALAATESIARVVDSAKGSYTPISPKKSIIYLGALLLGLLIPFAIIYLLDLLDTKIKSRLDLEGKSPIPFIGDVPSSDSPSEIIKSESRTSSAEALRIIRTNLEFMLTKVPEGIAKTIFLTSTFPKEGKTFVSVNLAATFALSGKKVLLIGMDIRNPRLDEYLSIPDRGVTNYLSSKTLVLEDLIVKYDGFEDFHILPAGIIPPNPAELLMNKKVDGLFESLKKQYDYIIVDTAPVSLVTDTLLIAKHADCFIYVARANFLEKRMLNIPNTLYKEQKLPNMCLLLNDTDSTKGYGYGYGYGVQIEKKVWYKRLLGIK
ncbi:polysaccharide biosynthesis tyrosine autokinase [Flavobacterium sp. K77]|uniref:non-specific protein-tyrosine kinase n=1 Tax=Flavobacterium turcicum TaxID=2764718 RepID=A0ABR7JIT4_9FLAO|nr:MULTISPECIES: tyrosine-protein kinase [Flavobacterium]MBC5864235.1 polysaccharide biosynthesis tyrosine autokinase [Flavobacterium turcicum]MCF6142074.1 polysaccharide biosynthesis tyrosine autokinase [Flavobacterium sp. K77]NHL03143.1 polysaccharide biosynthesis tyrosine autokinase [Flavobacterium turcicum]